MYRIPQTPDKVWEVLEPIKNNEETVNLLAKKNMKEEKETSWLEGKKERWENGLMPEGL